MTESFTEIGKMNGRVQVPLTAVIMIRIESRVSVLFSFRKESGERGKCRCQVSLKGTLLMTLDCVYMCKYK